MRQTLLSLLFLSVSMCCFAQKHTLTGTIYDEDKNVLADANVIVKNSTNGTVTNSHGRFAIEVAPKDVLEVSYLGFETKKIFITDQKKISFTLNSTSALIDAVEITVSERKITCTNTACTKISLSRSCGVTSHGILIEKSVQNEKRMETTLFPNPSANGLFQLQLYKSYTKLTLEVFNMNGQLLQSNTYTKLSKNPQIDLSKHPKGMYLVRIVADGTVLETKKAMRL
ncbi:TonB-dependent receptor SusC [Kordia sp. SMS9]|uniref:T9SS type A sorting domain-containing protein n=1 Tax=Kordia sp. SMS9 TaxID=2282170 RepID=UPI000E0CFAEB|nr:T9SS type A sorting domain-containing protein [Kordia sp. SMS9]AXG67937.1 TonB-dependent receptor SusC [Kordia sp. SMS9]